MPHHSTQAWTLLTQHLDAILALKADYDARPLDTMDPYEHSISHYVTRLEQKTTTLQEELLKGVCFEWTKEHPNVPIDHSAVAAYCQARHPTHWFDHDRIRHYLDDLYLGTAEQAALRHLITTAQGLLPGNRHRPTPVQDICHNRTLKLTGYIEHWGLKHSPSIELSRGTQHELIALWKLCAIVFDHQNPIDLTESEDLRRAIHHKHVIGHRWTCDPIEWQCFKNNRLDIHFHNPHRAQRIATILCEPDLDLASILPHDRLKHSATTYE